MASTDKYKALRASGRFSIFAAKEKEVGDSLEELIAACKQALQRKDLKEANQLSQRAAFLHGSSGLLLYYKTKFETLRQDQKEGEPIKVEASNLFTFLLLAKNLTSYEENADELIREYFPEYCNNGYVDWVALEELLIHLAEVEHWTEDPAELASKILKQSLE